VHPSDVRGRRFDESSVRIDWRPVSEFWARAEIDAETGEWTIRGGDGDPDLP
jgi:hypothetical protein